jgi:hypothetical protein
MNLPPTASLADPRHHDRIRRRTAGGVNDRIDRKTQARLDDLVGGDLESILARIHKLDREWDVERALITNFAIVGGFAFLQSRRFRKPNGWTALFASQLGFLLMHATMGWCPPLPVFRRLGFRTAKEIAAERQALVQQLDDDAATGPIPDREAERLREE